MFARSAKTDPLTPTRADYRLIKKLIDLSFGGKVVHLPDEYDLIIAVFGRAGGSWERVFRGSIDDLRLLKRIVKVAFKRRFLTHAPEWS